MALIFAVVGLWALPSVAFGAGTPYLDAIAHDLNNRLPGTQNETWWFTRGNELRTPEKSRFTPGWLLQTPNCWGQPRCSPNMGQEVFLGRTTEAIASAHKSVDIAELYQQFANPGSPDGPYLDHIVQGLKLGHDRHPNDVPVVRLLLGVYPPNIYDPAVFANALKARLGDWVKVQSGYMRSAPSGNTLVTDFSHNHEKVIDADGRTAIVGGMNYWTSDYFATTHPVSDISMEVTGPAAADVSRFTDILWTYTCSHRTSAGVSVYFVNLSSCINNAARQAAPVDPHGVPMIVVGKLGDGIVLPTQHGKESKPFGLPLYRSPACPLGGGANNQVNNSRAYEYRNPGETALRELILSAKHSIFISQQDLLSCLPLGFAGTEAKFDERVFGALAAKVHAGVPIKIVLSHGPGGGYSNGWKLKDVYDVLGRTLITSYRFQDANLARGMICRDVGLATIRNDAGATWPDGTNFHNHAKLVEVDDQAFYIGSENLYPSRLQELGLIVENPTDAAHLKAAYLDPLWHWSKPDALIDPDTKKCPAF